MLQKHNASQRRPSSNKHPFWGGGGGGLVGLVVDMQQEPASKKGWREMEQNPFSLSL